MMGDRFDRAADAFVRAMLEGVPPDPDAASRFGDREWMRIFRRLLEAHPEQGPERLAEIVARDPGSIGDLAAEALGRWGGRTAGRLLAGLDLERFGPGRRKAVRRGLHFHESTHGAVPAPSAKRRAKVEGASHEAFLDAPGMWGDRVWVFRRDPGAGSPGRSAVVAVSDRRGVRDFFWLEGGKATLERYRRMLAERGVVLVAVGWRFLVSRLRRVEEKNAGAGAPLPPNYAVLRDWLGVEAAGDRDLDHPARPVRGPVEVGEPPSREDVRALLTLPETREWAVAPDAFADRREEIREADRSRLVLDGLDPTERVHRILGTILDAMLAGDGREVWSLRLLDLAHVLNATGRAASGRIASFIARDIEAGKRSPAAAAFLWALGARALGLLRAEEEGEGARGAGEESGEETGGSGRGLP